MILGREVATVDNWLNLHSYPFMNAEDNLKLEILLGKFDLKRAT